MWGKSYQKRKEGLGKNPSAFISYLAENCQMRLQIEARKTFQAVVLPSWHRRWTSERQWLHMNSRVDTPLLHPKFLLFFLWDAQDGCAKAQSRSSLHPRAGFLSPQVLAIETGGSRPEGAEVDPGERVNHRWIGFSGISGEIQMGKNMEAEWRLLCWNGLTVRLREKDKRVKEIRDQFQWTWRSHWE
jgi:hypothetical protein